tara:strand:+ start:509 stop:934 length:426 start_codon:yes stop_codon:yes gene_type:complete
MSGIIGGAGSKSGVIGVTELDYEEGTWTPSNAGFDVTGSFTSGGQYKRFGKMILITAWVRGSTNIATSGGASTIGGSLPFMIGGGGSASGANRLAHYVAQSGAETKIGYAWRNNIYTTYAGTGNFAVSTDGIFFTMQYAID